MEAGLETLGGGGEGKNVPLDSNGGKLWERAAEVEGGEDRGLILSEGETPLQVALVYGVRVSCQLAAT